MNSRMRKILKVGLSAIVIVGIFSSIFKIYYSVGVSMEPTIKNGEFILVKKVNYTPKRFDIVIIYDENGKEYLEKRLIGLPGDTIEVRKGVIFLNKKKLKDPFGKGKILIYLVDENEKPLRYWETGEWGNAGDPIVELTSHKEEKIPKGHVWVIGDNREESWYGMLKTKNIKGRVLFH